MHKAFIRIGSRVINVNQIDHINKLGESVFLNFSSHVLELKGDDAKVAWAYFGAAVVSYNITPAEVS